MDFSLTEEQEALRESVAAMADKLSSTEVIRTVMGTESGFNEKLWTTATEFGLTALPLPEEHDGLDATLVEVCVVQEELGAHVASIPYWSTILAGFVVAENSTADLQRDLLPRIASGELKVAAHLPVGEPTIELVRGGELQTISGTLSPVIDGAIADAVLVPVLDAGEIAIALVELGDSTRRTALPRLDPTRSVTTLELDAAPAHVVAGAGALTRVRSLAATLLAAEQVGCARTALRMAVDYAQLRQQFGKPIGSNQGIKHRCANMFVDVETAWSTTFYAAWIGGHQPEGFDIAATVARLVTADASASATASNIQVHGGIGFTWEHDAHLYTKRAKASTLILGDPHRELEPLAGYLLTEGAKEGAVAWI